MRRRKLVAAQRQLIRYSGLSADRQGVRAFHHSRIGRTVGPDRKNYGAISKPTVTRAVIVSSPLSIGTRSAAPSFALSMLTPKAGTTSELSVIQATRLRLTPEACA